MDKEISERNKTARLAGLLYVLLVLSGIIYLVYIPSTLIDWQDTSKTFENIKNSIPLFKIGILVAICSFLIFTILPLVLFKLLSSINKSATFLMVLFALISIPVSFVNILNKFSILSLLKDNQSNLRVDGLEEQIMFYLEQYSNGLEVLQIFWGLWLLPFGYLVFQSSFLPKILGIFLMSGCFGYLISFFGGFLFENFSNTILSNFIGLPAAIGEIGVALWLLIMGTNNLKRMKS